MSRWNKLRAVMMICTALGWWSVWFPEFAVWADAVCVVSQEEEDAIAISRGMAHADREQIHIKSRLLQLLKQQLQKEE